MADEVLSASACRIRQYLYRALGVMQASEEAFCCRAAAGSDETRRHDNGFLDRTLSLRCGQCGPLHPATLPDEHAEQAPGAGVRSARRRVLCWECRSRCRPALQPTRPLLPVLDVSAGEREGGKQRDTQLRMLSGLQARCLLLAVVDVPAGSREPGR